MIPIRLVAVLLTFGVMLWAGSARAAGPSKEECAEAYESAQEHRAAGRLQASFEQLKICGQQRCPSFIGSDCMVWRMELEQEMASVLVAAKTPAGDDTVDVRVYVDDTLVAEKLEGAALFIEAGDHTLRFETPGGVPIERELSLASEDKNQFIELEFESDGSEPADEPPRVKAAAPPPPDVADDAASEPAPDDESGPTSLKPYAYLAGGVGAASLIAGVIVGAVAKGEVSDMRSGCAQTPEGCSQASVDAAHTKLVVADVLMGVGIVGIGGGVALFLLSPPESGEADAGALRLNASVSPSGGFARLTGSF